MIPSAAPAGPAVSVADVLQLGMGPLAAAPGSGFRPTPQEVLTQQVDWVALGGDGSRAGLLVAAERVNDAPQLEAFATAVTACAAAHGDRFELVIGAVRRLRERLGVTPGLRPLAPELNLLERRVFAGGLAGPAGRAAALAGRVDWRLLDNATAAAVLLALAETTPLSRVEEVREAVRLCVAAHRGYWTIATGAAGLLQKRLVAATRQAGKVEPT